MKEPTIQESASATLHPLHCNPYTIIKKGHQLFLKVDDLLKKHDRLFKKPDGVFKKRLELFGKHLGIL